MRMSLASTTTSRLLGRVAAWPEGATIRDLTGKCVLPGFTNTHFHWAYVRRGELDLQSCGVPRDARVWHYLRVRPSPLSIDMLAYEVMIDAGMMTGSRVQSTGHAVFSFNNSESEQQTLNVLSRYPELYRTRNLKNPTDALQNDPKLRHFEWGFFLNQKTSGCA